MCEAMTSEFIQTLQRVENACVVLARMDSKTVEVAVSRIDAINTFMEQYGDLGKVFEHFRELESKLFLCRDMLTMEEAANYLGITKSHMYRLTADREVSFHKPNGKMVYIARTELDGFKKRNRVKSKYEQEQDAVAVTMAAEQNAKKAKKGGSK